MNKEINTLEDFCKQINISYNFLKYVLYVKKKNYRQFIISKGNGKFRIITAPNEELKYIQRQLLLFLERNYNFLDCQYGFIKGRNCVLNASNHVGKRFVLNCDIENFGRVRGLFLNKPFNYSNEVATTIAKIVCYKGRLPQGAPTSPIISNMICYTMDKEFDFIAKKNNCKYTRYADDITFSTDSEFFSNNIIEIKNDNIIFSERIIKTLNGGYSNGFRFNNSKTKLCKRYYRQEVTGIVVNRKTNVNKKYINNLRATLHNIQKYGYIDTYIKTFNMSIKNEKEARKKLFNYLIGKINYLKMVKSDTDGLYLKYANEFNKVFDCLTFDITDEIRIRNYAQRKCYVIKSACNTGSGFSISKNQIITSTHVILNNDTYRDFIYNKDSSKYDSQFPINSNNMEFVYLLHPNLKNEKLISDFNINKTDCENDIISLSIQINNKNQFKLAHTKAKTGDIVYLIGYPAFNGFNNTDLHIIKTKVIGENSFLGIKLINTYLSPKHGMSGGPVLNTNKEVVGIIFAGDDENNNAENVGFISLL